MYTLEIENLDVMPMLFVLQPIQQVLLPLLETLNRFMTGREATCEGDIWI